jgi:uncharacterized protein
MMSDKEARALRSVAMIIDADVHISPFTASPYDITTDELLRRMDRARVERALTWLRPPYHRDVAAGNRYVCRAAREHPDRITGFGWADPHFGFDAMRDETDRCLGEYGFAGIKLNGAQNEFTIDDPVLVLPLVEHLAGRGAVVAFHVGGDAPEATHPHRLGRIAALFPQTRFLMVHMGGVAFHDLSDPAIDVLSAHRNVTAIGSAVRPVNVLKAIRAVGDDRICFGSDAPFNLIHVEVAAYGALLEDELTPEGRARVMAGNIAALLGIPL